MFAKTVFLSIPLFTLLTSGSPVRNFTELLERRDVDINKFRGHMPSCDPDPSWEGPSSFQDGEGVYMGSACENNEALSKWRCWCVTSMHSSFDY
jgi:hypothetical protein